MAPGEIYGRQEQAERVRRAPGRKSFRVHNHLPERLFATRQAGAGPHERPVRLQIPIERRFAAPSRSMRITEAAPARFFDWHDSFRAAFPPCRVTATSP